MGRRLNKPLVSQNLHKCEHRRVGRLRLWIPVDDVLNESLLIWQTPQDVHHLRLCLRQLSGSILFLFHIAV